MSQNENTTQLREPGDVLAELQRIVASMFERDSRGIGVTDDLRRARKLVDGLAPAPSLAIVAGYQMKANARVFYPAGWRPTDINNFQTLVYADGEEGAAEPKPHYVLRYVDRVNGPLGKTHGLVSVADWNAGMSQAVAERVCDSEGRPLVVYPGPAADKAAEPLESTCS